MWKGVVSDERKCCCVIQTLMSRMTATAHTAHAELFVEPAGYNSMQDRNFRSCLPLQQITFVHKKKAACSSGLPRSGREAAQAEGQPALPWQALISGSRRYCLPFESGSTNVVPTALLGIITCVHSSTNALQRQRHMMCTLNKSRCCDVSKL
jgi:hypothetical protein